MGWYDDVAGVADHLAGSTDEAVARSFDDEEGGGLWDGATGVLDHAAGSTDEAVARSFDDEEGGGLWDGFAGVLDHAAGSTDEAVARQFDNEEGGGFADVAAAQYWSLWDWMAGDLDDTIRDANPERWALLGGAALVAFLAAREFGGAKT